MIGFHNFSGEFVFKSLEETDTIKDIAAISHMSVNEWIDIIHEIIDKDIKEIDGRIAEEAE